MKIKLEMNVYAVIIGILGLYTVNTLVIDKAFKRLKFISDKLVGYVDINMLATVKPEDEDIMSFTQENVKSSIVFKDLRTGVIQLEQHDKVLKMAFKYTETTNGYNLDISWISFGTSEIDQLFHTKEELAAPLTLGSNTITLNNIKFSNYPENSVETVIKVEKLTATIHINTLASVKYEKDVKSFDEDTHHSKSIAIYLYPSKIKEKTIEELLPLPNE